MRTRAFVIASLVTLLVTVHIGTADASDATPIWGDAATAAQPYFTWTQDFWAKRGAHTSCESIEILWWDFRDPLDPSDDGQAAWGRNCKIWIVPGRWSNEFGPVWRCMIVLHEFGHAALGLNHEWNDSRHVMFWSPRIHPACRNAAYAHVFSTLRRPRGFDLKVTVPPTR